ncbi:MAG: permease-like cell division protein FtsX [Candidatus Aminicenantes bacterium]|nr:permease-like cell division protein FtsX [Candidatus Aminicenantes bacterium]
MSVVFFLERGLPADLQRAIIREIEKSAYVAETREVSPEQARERLRVKFPELREVLMDIGTSPFPPSIEATLKKEDKDAAEVGRFLDQMRNTRGVVDIQYNRDWVERMQSLSRLARAVGFFLGGILVLASFFIISNVIKLNVFARRNEIEILRFVGATNTFIRIPFLLEGITLGVLGGLLSLALLGILISLFPFYLGQSLGALKDIINFRYLSIGQSLSLITGGGLMGFLGSLTSLQRFLKI